MADLTIVLFCCFLLAGFSCAPEEAEIDVAQIEHEVWQTVLAHNRAWSQLEDLNELAAYVHADIVSVSPPFHEVVEWKDAYLEAYQNWFDHATVHHFREVDHTIALHGDGSFAVVIYKIDMSFDYDERKVDSWQGMDMMTLVREGGGWSLTSDMFAQQKEE